MTNKQIKKRIKLAMHLTNIKYESIADKEGVSKQNVYSKVHSKRISISTLEMVSKATGFPVDWFISGNGSYFNDTLSDALKAHGYISSVVEDQD